MFDVDAVQAVQIGLVTVLVPPAASVRHGAAHDGLRQVAVFGGEQALVVVTQRVA